jgi:hypothetical protein
MYCLNGHGVSMAAGREAGRFRDLPAAGGTRGVGSALADPTRAEKEYLDVLP